MNMSILLTGVLVISPFVHGCSGSVKPIVDIGIQAACGIALVTITDPATGAKVAEVCGEAEPIVTAVISLINSLSKGKKAIPDDGVEHVLTDATGAIKGKIWGTRLWKAVEASLGVDAGAP